MSIRPIDLQAAVPRSYEINRTSGIDASRPEMQQQHFAKQLDKEIKHDEQAVKQSAHAEKGLVNRDGSNKNKDSRKKDGEAKKGKSKDAAEALKSYKSMSMVDIKI